MRLGAAFSRVWLVVLRGVVCSQGTGGGGCHAQKQITEAPLQTTGQGSDCLLECSSHTV